jgi:PAS domain S-box-containing protein
MEDRLPDFLKNSGVYAIAITDMHGTYTYVNDHFRQRFAYLGSEFIGKHSMDSIYEQDHARCYTAIEQCLLSPDQPHAVRLRKPLNSRGDFEWTQWEFSPILDDKRQPEGILCVGHEITALKLAHEKLEANKLQLEQIANQQAHQLRGPVSSLMMLLNTISDQRNGNELSEYLDMLQEVGGRIDDAIREIVDLT